MSFSLDIAILLIITLSSVVGYMRGFVRSVIRIFGTILCIIIALIVSDLAAPTVYNNFVAPKVSTMLEEKFRGFDVTKEVRKTLEASGVDIPYTDEQINKALQDTGNISESIEKLVSEDITDKREIDEIKKKADGFLEKDLANVLLEKSGYKDSESVNSNLKLPLNKANDLVKAFASDNGIANGAKYITNNVIDEFMVSITKYLMFVIILIVLKSLMAIIFVISKVFDHLPAVSNLNRLLGMFLGMTKGVLCVVLAAWIFAVITKSGNLLDTTTIDKTYVFKYIFYLFYNS